MRQRYESESRQLINSVAAFLEVNNEYVTPRVEQVENKNVIDEIQKGDRCVNYIEIIEQEFPALFNMYKMLLNHPQNTKEQIELQKEKMYEMAREIRAEELFEKILAEKRLIKLDETNYIKYLKEIVSVLDETEASRFINTLAKDISDCMLVDDVMEFYEQEIIQNIENTFSYLLDTKNQD